MFPRTSVDNITKNPKTIIIKKKNTFIKNCIQNANKIRLNKYFNIKKNPSQEQTYTFNAKIKAAVIKKRVINLQKKSKDDVNNDKNVGNT